MITPNQYNGNKYHFAPATEFSMPYTEYLALVKANQYSKRQSMAVVNTIKAIYGLPKKQIRKDLGVAV